MGRYTILSEHVKDRIMEWDDSSDERVIHIVDDEKDIVNIATRTLQNAGYTVHSFTSASEALKDIELKCKKKVKMLITDVRMAELSGFDLARRTRRIVPDAPIIFMTAFEINSIEFEKIFPSLQVSDFIQKPFHIQELLEVVRKHDKA